MLTALTVLTDELRRIKASGVSTVDVSEESIQALRSAVLLHVNQLKSEVNSAPKVNSEVLLAKEPVTVSKVKNTAYPVAPYFKLPDGSKADQLKALHQIMLEDPVTKCPPTLPSKRKLRSKLTSIPALTLQKWVTRRVSSKISKRIED